MEVSISTFISSTSLLKFVIDICSGNGRTYFYVTRDILGEKNEGFDADVDCDDYVDSTFDDIIDTSRHINEQGTAIQVLATLLA